MISPQTPRVRSCTTVLGSDSRRLFYRGQRRGVFALQVTLGGAGEVAPLPPFFLRPLHFHHNDDGNAGMGSHAIREASGSAVPNPIRLG